MTQSQGVVKSFSTRNGYGFIADDAGGEDFFFGKEQIPREWAAMGPKLEGMEVVFEIHNGDDGRAQARNVRPANAPQPGKVTSGVVKSWNSQKGFGFMSAPGLNDDVFFARDRLPNELRGLQHFNGMTLMFELDQKPDGKYHAHNVQVPNNDGPGSNQQNSKKYSKLVPDAMPRHAPRNDRPGPKDHQGPRKRPAGPTPQVAQKRAKTENEGRRIGTIKSFSSKNGFGFIICPDSHEDLIFYQRDCPEDVRPGETVEFTVRINSNGREQAHDIVLTQGGKQDHRGAPEGFIEAKDYPPLSVDELKLYAEQLNRNDLSELARFSAEMLQKKISRNEP